VEGQPPFDALLDGEELFGPCPGCGSTRFKIVRHAQDTNFRCESCGRCWYVAMGLHLYRVDPLSCPGCPDRARCAAELPDDDPFHESRPRAELAGQSP
jgi:hypothetical protein